MILCESLMLGNAVPVEKLLIPLSSPIGHAITHISVVVS